MSLLVDRSSDRGERRGYVVLGAGAVSVTSLLMVLKQHGDDLIKVSPAAVADQTDRDVTSIQQLLDDVIYLVEAEEVLAGYNEDSERGL